LLLGFCPFFLSASRLAFTHGHVFCTWLILAGLYCLDRLRTGAALPGDLRTDRWYAGAAGICLGAAAGSDLLACFWVLSVVILMHIWILRASLKNAISHFESFAVGAFVGLLAASPMYLSGFPHCLGNIWESLRHADSGTGYLWLGSVVNRLPIYYYGVVLATKLTPVIVILAIMTVVWYVRRVPGRSPFCLTLAFLLWPIAYLSVKSWKNPYYLIPFVPAMYILIVDGLHMLWVHVSKQRPYVACAVVALAVASQLYAVVRMHPDYLMQGIQYSDQLYGEFQGPAVSHGQWIGEALRDIKQDCGGRQALVYTVTDVGTPQILYYSKKYDIPALVGEIPPVNLAEQSAATCNVYILMSRDAKEMICPAHQNAIRDNKALVSFLENATEYALTKTYGASRFPMVWVYKRMAGDD
jgi:hypothetical protein